MATRSHSIRTTDAEMAVWGEAAAAEGMKLNTWMRRSLTRQAELELAVRKMQQDEQLSYIERMAAAEAQREVAR